MKYREGTTLHSIGFVVLAMAALCGQAEPMREPAQQAEDSSKWPYRDPAQPVAVRVKDLLSRMTVDEKLAQLGKLRAFRSYSREGGRIVPHPDEVAGIMTNCPGTAYGLLRADFWSGRNWNTGVTPEMAVREQKGSDLIATVNHHSK